MQTSRAVFYSLAALLFGVTGLAKLVGLTEENAFLGTSPPSLTFLSWRQLLLLAGMLEVITVIVIIAKRASAVPAQVILATSSAILGYKILLASIGYVAPCNCLGFFGSWLGLDTSTIDVFTWSSIVVMVVGALYFSCSASGPFQDLRDLNTLKGDSASESLSEQ